MNESTFEVSEEHVFLDLFYGDVFVLNMLNHQLSEQVLLEICVQATLGGRKQRPKVVDDLDVKHRNNN